MAKGNSGRRWWAWFASLLLHMVVAVSLLVRLPAPRPQAASDQVRVIQAQLIDTTRLQADREAEAEAKHEAEAEAKREAQAEAKREAQAEAKREAQAEAKRQAETEAKRQAETEAKRQAEAEAKRQAEAEAKRQAEAEAKRQAEAEARRQALIAEEEQARQASLLSAYAGEVTAAIRRAWRRPPSAPRQFECRVRVRQSSDGQVISASIVKSCGDALLDRSVEQAVFRASPLPTPGGGVPVPAELDVTFRP